MVGENILENPTVKIALDDASRYTTQFQYSLIPSNVDDNGSTRVMRVKFDEQAVDEKLTIKNNQVSLVFKSKEIVTLLLKK